MQMIFSLSAGRETFKGRPQFSIPLEPSAQFFDKDELGGRRQLVPFFLNQNRTAYEGEQRLLCLFGLLKISEAKPTRRSGVLPLLLQKAARIV
jgi:hypothetical protein